MDDASIDTSAIEKGNDDWIRAKINPDMESTTSGGPGSLMKNRCNAWLHVEGTESSSAPRAADVTLVTVDVLTQSTLP